MKKILLAIALFLIGVLSFQTVFAGSFYYIPTQKDISLLEKIETKIQLLAQEKLPILREKIEEISGKIISPRSMYLIDTVLNLLTQESERRKVALEKKGDKTLGEVESQKGKSSSSVQTLTISEAHASLFKKREGYRYNQ